MKKLFRSFKDAIRGIRYVFKHEQNFRIQIVVGLLVIVLAFVWPLMVWEQVVVFFMVALVLILELINTVFERLVDSFKPRLSPVVGEIKDIMAATVLLASFFAAIVGIIIFGPHVIELLSYYV